MESPPAKKKKSTKAEADEGVWILKLYVAGQTTKSIAAFANLNKICDEHLRGKYRIEIVDLLKNPKLGKGDRILAVPTLVKKLPAPVEKIIGDLADTEHVLIGLELQHANGSSVNQGENPDAW